MVRILASEVDRLRPTAKGFIFDGFPRTIPQAEELAKMLHKRGEKVDCVIGLEVPDDELTKRLIERGKVSGRADDNETAIRERLGVYHDTTSPLKDYYVKDGSYRAVPGVGSIDDIFTKIASHIDPINN